jgi:hypothetical protein
MDEKDQLKHTRSKALEELWNPYRQRMLTRGIDLDSRIRSWAENEAEKLHSSIAQSDYVELCRAGCSRPILGAITALMRYAPHIEPFWTEIVGSPYKRDKIARDLERAAKAIEELMGNSADEYNRIQPIFPNVDIVPPLRMVSELRLYARVVNFAGELSSSVAERSIHDVSKYLLSYYAKRATGRFHDKTVSALVGVLADAPTLNETAYRMWRQRNYRRIEKRLGKTAEFLFDLACAIFQST